MYIYLGTYFHTHHKGVISVIDENGEYVTLEKKIGKTINLDQRESSLNRTKSPIGYTFLKVWKTGDDTNRIELAIHDLLANSRTEGEWFADGDDTLTERLSSFMDRMGFPVVQLDNATEELATQITTKSDLHEEHKALNARYPGLFTNMGRDFVSNNSGSLNVGMSIKKSGFNVGVGSPDYKRYSCTLDQNFQDTFNDVIASSGYTAAFNAKAGYVPRIETEEQAISIFNDLKAAIDSGRLTLSQTS